MAAEITGDARPLPAFAERSAPNTMSSEKLKALGWVPGGRARLFDFLRLCLASGPGGAQVADTRR
jgi:hypothetical protein